MKLINMQITSNDSDYQVDLSLKHSSSDSYMVDRPIVTQTILTLKTLAEKISGKELSISSMENMWDSGTGIQESLIKLKETGNLSCQQVESTTTNQRSSMERPYGLELESLITQSRGSGRTSCQSQECRCVTG